LRQNAYHGAVRKALEKDGWKVTHDSLIIRLEGVKFYVNLADEEIIENEETITTVAIEIKVFGGLSFLNELEKAVRQYLIYRQFLTDLFPERVLFLAILFDVFEESFSLPSIKVIVKNRR
jgi:XisH protein